MLILTQSEGDSVYFFDKDGKKILRSVFIKKENRSGQIKVGFEASDDIKIFRGKLLAKIKGDNYGNI